jgi:hypothetical protein
MRSGIALNRMRAKAQVQQCCKLFRMHGFWRAALLLAGAAVLAAVVVSAGGATVARMLWQIGWGFFALTALRAAYVALRAGALWRTMPKGILPYRALWWIRLSSEAVEMLTLTGPLLAEPAKGWLLKRHGLSTRNAVRFVALEYLLYTMLTAWMAGVALWMLLDRDTMPAAWRLPVIVILCMIAVVTAAFLYAAVSGTGLIAPIVRRAGDVMGRGRGAAAAARIEPSEREIVAFLHSNGRDLLDVLAMQAATQVLLTLEVWIVFRALGAHVTLVDSFVFEGAAKFIDVAFFFVPGQLGAHEGLYSVIAAGIGVAPAAGLALSLARRIRGVIVGLGAVFAR